jgi:hypothetical protein
MTLISKFRNRLYQLYDEVDDMDVLDLVPRLTLVLLILYSGKYWYLRVPMTVICTCGILFRSIYQSASFWFLLTMVMAWGNFSNWYAIDNHKYLMTYWGLALYCSLLSPDPRKAIILNGRLLIGLCFAFSTLWKVLSDDFLNGSFFHYTFLLDSRFGDVAEILGGMTDDALFQNELRMMEFLRYDSTLQFVKLLDSPRIPLLAKVVTWWIFSIELLLAIAFLGPTDRFISKWRDGTLLFFALSTYSVAHVVGFGWLLMVMGVAQ